MVSGAHGRAAFFRTPGRRLGRNCSLAADPAGESPCLASARKMHMQIPTQPSAAANPTGWHRRPDALEKSGDHEVPDCRLIVRRVGPSRSSRRRAADAVALRAAAAASTDAAAAARHTGRRAGVADRRRDGRPAWSRDPTGIRSEFAGLSEFGECCGLSAALTLVQTTRSRRATTTATTRRRTPNFKRRSRPTVAGTTTARTATSGRPACPSSGPASRLMRPAAAGRSPSTAGPGSRTGAGVGRPFTTAAGSRALAAGAGFRDRCGARPGSPGARAAATSDGRRSRRAALRLAGGYGAGSPWRFAPAASLGTGRPTFISPRNLPGVFARTTVVSNDRLLTRGNWSVHVNAGPTRGIAARPVSLSRVAPAALPRVAVYPHPGVSLNARPWTRTPEARGDDLTHGWHAGAPASQPHTVGRAPAYGSSPAARAEVHAPSASWSQRPAPVYGSAGGNGHPYTATQTTADGPLLRRARRTAHRAATAPRTPTARR